MSELTLLENFLKDPNVTDVLVDGHFSAHIEREGNLEKVENPFEDEQTLAAWIKKLLRSYGSRIDISKPFSEVSFESEFGLLRVHAALAGECSKRTLVSIRRHNVSSLSLHDLERSSFISREGFITLSEIIKRRENFVIIGGTGSGKTTLLKAMLSEVSNERVITIEDAAELSLGGNSISLTTRSNNHEGIGQISLGQLLREALRMRPDRLVIGEARGEELLVLLQSMNTGHSGSGFTLHANSIADATPRMLAILTGVGIAPSLGEVLVSTSITWFIEVRRVGSVRQVTEIKKVSSKYV